MADSNELVPASASAFQLSQEDDLEAQLDAERLLSADLERQAKRQRQQIELRDLKRKNAALAQQVRTPCVVFLFYLVFVR